MEPVPSAVSMDAVLANIEAGRSPGDMRVSDATNASCCTVCAVTAGEVEVDEKIPPADATDAMDCCIAAANSGDSPLNAGDPAPCGINSGDRGSRLERAVLCALVGNQVGGEGMDTDGWTGTPANVADSAFSHGGGGGGISESFSVNMVASDKS